MRVFLISGKAGVGKNEVAKLIKEYYNEKEMSTVITSFSKYLKMYAREMTNWDGKEETKPRHFLQTLGSVIREDMKWPYFFIDRMFKDLEIYDRYFDNVVISDVRLIEEIRVLKLEIEDCISIHVIGNQSDKLTIEENNHITEVELDNYKGFDYVIENYDYSKLKSSVYKILGEVK